MTRTLTGLDRLLADPSRLSGRRFGVLAHGASIDARARPIHLALAAAGFPAAKLFGPEHGFYGIEQDMVASEGGLDPWTGAPLESLYGESESTLRPDPSAFADLDLLIVDVQDVGSRYYTYAATGIWAAEAARKAGCEVWVLDRPNPLGGKVVEGNVLQPGFESFVGAFHLPVRHGLTLGELFRLRALREGGEPNVEVWTMRGWDRYMTWADTGLPWIAPSPNMPTPGTAVVYPGGCLIEATELSEGRGTTRPFHLTGAPGLDPLAFAKALEARDLPGVRFVPTWFRPQFQKHRGEICGGVELVVEDTQAFRSYRVGIEMLDVAARLGALTWRTAPYEFVEDIPAIDLLTGGTECRTAIESGEGLADWMATFAAEEVAFRAERRGILLYPEG